MERTKLVEIPVVDSVPARRAVLYTGVSTSQTPSGRLRPMREAENRSEPVDSPCDEPDGELGRSCEPIRVSIAVSLGAPRPLREADTDAVTADVATDDEDDDADVSCC